MKKRKIRLVLVLYGLVILTLLKGPGSVRASSLEPSAKPRYGYFTNQVESSKSSLGSPTIQLQSSKFTYSPGTVTVSATCPQNYHVQSGKAEITQTFPYHRQPPKYAIQFNGPSAQGTAWITTVENKIAADMSIIVKATCAAT